MTYTVTIVTATNAETFKGWTHARLARCLRQHANAQPGVIVLYYLEKNR
jgi:hypothetical protein